MTIQICGDALAGLSMCAEMQETNTAVRIKRKLNQRTEFVESVCRGEFYLKGKGTTFLFFFYHIWC